MGDASVFMREREIEDDALVVRVRRLHGDAKMPTKGTAGSAGWDICALLPMPFTLYPGEVFKCPTGLAFAIPSEHEGQIRVRSGLSTKHGITLINATATIDSDYRGEVFVPLINLSPTAYPIQPCDRIAQIIIAPVPKTRLVEVDELEETDRGVGGFGSTGR